MPGVTISLDMVVDVGTFRSARNPAHAKGGQQKAGMHVEKERANSYGTEDRICGRQHKARNGSSPHYQTHVTRSHDPRTEPWGKASPRLAGIPRNMRHRRRITV